MFFVTSALVVCFLRGYERLGITASLMGYETCPELTKIEVRGSMGGLLEVLCDIVFVQAPGLFFRSVLLIVDELNLLKSCSTL